MNMSFKRYFKCAALTVMKFCGVFRLVRFFSRNELRILCYHGFSFDDEHLFRPGLFMQQSTFERRLEILKAMGYRVVSLADGLRMLKEDSIRSNTAVITFDDGFVSNHALMGAPLKKYGYPSTLYVTTYYVQQQTPIFRLLVQYVAWRAPTRISGFQDFLPEESRLPIALGDEAKLWGVIEFGEQQLSEAGRVELSKKIVAYAGLDYNQIFASKKLHLMTADQVKELVEQGIDIQLHTHRHRFPDDPELVRREVRDNRAVLEPLTGKPVQHLCYPSGVYHKAAWKVLEEEGVLSAVTCEAGSNVRSTAPLGLKRFLDSETIEEIEFRAEVSGVSDLLRSMVAQFRGRATP